MDYIEHPPKWTNEEVEAYLDWDAEETIEIERQEQAEFDIRGGFSAERGIRVSHGLHARSGGVDYFSLALGDSKVYSHDFATKCLGGWYIHNISQTKRYPLQFPRNPPSYQRLQSGVMAKPPCNPFSCNCDYPDT